MAIGKRLKSIREGVDREKLYSIDEAVKMIEQNLLKGPRRLGKGEVEAEAVEADEVDTDEPEAEEAAA